MKLKIGLLYLSLHCQLKKSYGVDVIISRKDFFSKIGKHFMTPKNLRPIIMKEMIEGNLIEQIDRDNIKILPIDIDIESEANRLYKLVGLI